MRWVSRTRMAEPGYASLTDQPPSTTRTAPVTARAAGPSRKAAAPATSSASSIPPTSGCFAAANRRIRSSACARRLIGVRVRPGAIALTRILARRVRGGHRARHRHDRALAGRVGVRAEELRRGREGEHAGHVQDRAAQAVRAGRLAEHPG